MAATTTSNGRPFYEFQILVIKAVDPLLSAPRSSSEPPVHGTLYGNNARTDSSRRLDRGDRLLLDVVHLLTELSDSLGMLNDIDVYMRRFPFRSYGVPPTRYLRYHIGNYLGEMYVIKERLITLAKLVEKAYSKNARRELVRTCAANARKIAEESLEQIAKVRGSHIHKSRYSDTEIEEFELYALLSNTPDDPDTPPYSLLHDFTYKNLRKKWCRLIATNNQNLARVLDNYCAAILPALFSDDGSFIRP